MARGRLVLGMLLLLATGCGRSGGQVSVRGEVTLDGKPVGPGSIMFLPEDGTESRKAAAAIEDGKYDVSTDRGPSPGTFRVEINWAKKTGRKIPSADPGMILDETQEGMPAKFNEQSTLKVTIKSGPNVHDFHLQSR